MKKPNKSQLRYLLTALFLVAILFKLTGQATIPDELIKKNLKDQLNYLEERTKIYEYYRAIREDMFQKIKRNITDTISLANGRINILNSTITDLNHTIDSLTSDLASAKTSLEEVTNTKNSISVFGLEINKLTYNTIMWLIIIGLGAILVLFLLSVKRNMVVNHNLKKELDDLKNEFQSYKKTAREAREKMSMDHFNEMKRLKGSGA